jgi:CHASE2 domain-containing sensor protein
MTGNQLSTIALRQAEIVAKAAIIAGFCGAISTVPFSSTLQALLLLVLVLVGAGSAAMCWVDLPPAVTVAAVVGISVISVMSLAVVMAWLGVWYPIPSCLIVSIVVVTCGFVRLKKLQSPMAESG